MPKANPHLAISCKTSMHIGKKWSAAHNRRTYDHQKWNRDGHIVSERSSLNVTLCDTELRSWFHHTFDAAIAENPGAKPLFHSDRGFQYTNRAFHSKLEAAGMTQSMSRVGKCIDNSPMEGFWGILKRERYYGKRFTDRETLVKMIEDYIEYYNNKRLHRNLGFLTPMEKYEQYLAAA